MMKTGRNDPCPCGSGKKYKHCCLLQTDSMPHSVSDELNELLANQEFDSLDDAQALTDSFVEKKNQQAQDDFLGLSSEHIFKMLHFPYDTPDMYQFAEQLSNVPKAPILQLVDNIVLAIDKKGLKATAKGNLPQKLCRDAWSQYSDIYPDDFRIQFHKVNKEDDFFELHVTRILLELTGFLRKTKGRFYLTQKYQKAMKQSGYKSIYPMLFKTYCTKFNWSYWDRHSDVPFIQQSFLFTLYLLKHHGKQWTLNRIYEDGFLTAFPMVVDDMDESSYSSPEDGLRRCYLHRAIEHFLVFLGLADIKLQKGKKLYERQYNIKKTSLFNDMVHFNLIDPDLQKKVNVAIVNTSLH